MGQSAAGLGSRGGWRCRGSQRCQGGRGCWVVGLVEVVRLFRVVRFFWVVGLSGWLGCRYCDYDDECSDCEEFRTSQHFVVFFTELSSQGDTHIAQASLRSL